MKIAIIILALLIPAAANAWTAEQKAADAAQWPSLYKSETQNNLAHIQKVWPCHTPQCWKEVEAYIHEQIHLEELNASPLQ
jgi:hypothetical protein